MEYLLKLCENIPENRLYEKQLDGFNSAGWVLGHLCVEVDDVFDFLNLEYKENIDWRNAFKNTSGKITTIDGLPTKEELINAVKEKYERLIQAYKNLSPEQCAANHPSKFLKDIFPNVDSWFAHHLTTHVAIHCGNLVVWKKIVGIEVNGY